MITIWVAQLSPTFSESLTDLIFEVVPKLLWAIVILLFTRIVTGIVERVSQRLLIRIEPTLRKFLVQVLIILTWVTGTLAALNALAIQTTTIIAVLGAAGIAIGLALQNSLSHFAAGVLLISFRPFEVGDFIEGAGVAGIVEGIGLFSTTILTPDNVRITVPNSNLFSGTLKNTTVMGTRRVDLEIDIGDRPINTTIAELLSLVQPHPLILNNPPVTCHVSSIAPNSTILYLRPWCATEVYAQVRSEVLQIAKEALQTIEVNCEESQTDTE
jgi:small conductance mechanosensitive channel